MPLRFLLLPLACMVACGGSAAPAADAGHDPDGASSLCANRTDGALITLQSTGEQITLWITDDDFIDEAIARMNSGETPRVPNFEQIIAGTDCDPRWSFHVHANNLAWADFTVEVCDATPSYIENDVSSWIESVGYWCPWGVQAVTDVDDRR